MVKCASYRLFEREPCTQELIELPQANQPLFHIRQKAIRCAHSRGRIGVLLHLPISAMTHRGATLPLLRGNTNLESALEQEEDVLLEGITQSNALISLCCCTAIEAISNVLRHTILVSVLQILAGLAM
jgi:hypothetical protein